MKEMIQGILASPGSVQEERGWMNMKLKKNASHPGGDWLATVHGAKGLDGDLDKNCHESTDLYRLK